MKPRLMTWMTAVALGLFLTAAGCGDKGESGTPPPAGLPPAPAPERTGPEGNIAPGVAADQGTSGTDNEQSPEGERKSQPR